MARTVLAETFTRMLAPQEPTQKLPENEQEMRLRPHHGEQCYQGFNRLRDKVAFITGRPRFIRRDTGTRRHD